MSRIARGCLVALLLVGAATLGVQASNRASNYKLPWSVGLPPEAATAPIGTTTYASYGVYANSGKGYMSFADSGTAQQSTIWWVRLPDGYDSSQNTTFEFEVAAAGTSQAVSFGLAVGTLTGADLDTTAIATILDTAITGDTTTSGTQGIAVTLTYTVANTDMDAPAAGDWIVIQLHRRAPQDSSAVTAYVTGGSLSQ